MHACVCVWVYVQHILVFGYHLAITELKIASKQSNVFLYIDFAKDQLFPALTGHVTYSSQIMSQSLKFIQAGLKFIQCSYI